MNRSYRSTLDRSHKSRSQVNYRGNNYQEIEYTILQEVENELEESHIPLKSKQIEPFVIKEVLSGDSLQVIALKCNCHVADLKRLNNIIRDNEIYARRYIKIPLRPGVAVTDLLAAVHGNSISSNSQEPLVDLSETVEPKCNDTLNESSDTVKPFEAEKSVKVALDHINSQSTSCILRCNESMNDVVNGSEIIDDEISSTIEIEVNRRKHILSLLVCDGTDCGFSWTQVIVLFVLLGCAFPVLYVVYNVYKLHSNKR